MSRSVTGAPASDEASAFAASATSQTCASCGWFPMEISDGEPEGNSSHRCWHVDQAYSDNALVEWHRDPARGPAGAGPTRRCPTPSDRAGPPGPGPPGGAWAIRGGHE